MGISKYPYRKLRKTCQSYMVILPKEMVLDLGWDHGDDLEITEKEGEIKIRRV